MADITRRLPFEISSVGGAGTTGSYALTDYSFDYAIGGLPFMSASRDAWPYTEGMAEIRKQQFDSSAEPGEQSIFGWWLRSQSNFTGGAGLLYQDPDTQNPYVRAFDLRFADSLGVDSWTSGELRLLRDSIQKVTGLASTVNYVQGFVDPSGVDAAWYMDGTTFKKITDAGTTSITWGTVGSPLGLASSGSRYFLLATDGVWTGVDTGAATKIYNVVGAPTTGAIGYVKDRLVWGWDNILYSGAANPTAPPVAPVAAYPHSNALWQWTSISEGPNAIYIAGNNTTTGTIYKMTLNTSTSTPVLGAVTVSAQMPTGEKIRTIYGYVGSFLGIATDKGFRVGDLDANGDVAYGPLLFSPVGGCQSITGFDRFMWTGSTTAHDGSSGLYRVDLGSVIQEQTTQAVRYAFARDIYAPGEINPVFSVSMFGGTDRKIYSVQSDSIWIEHATQLVSSGYLKTGRIRYNTEEPKLYKFISLRTPVPLQGDVQVSILDQGNGVTPYATYGPNFAPGTGDISTPQPNGPQNWIALQFTLTRGAVLSQGGILNGWQVKALPGSIRQRMINQTFLLFDMETDKGGQNLGYDGYARSRFETFKSIARAGDVVSYQELSDDVSTLVVIDDWKYTQLAPPGPNGGSLGGYLTVTMRTVAESK